MNKKKIRLQYGVVIFSFVTIIFLAIRFTIANPKYELILTNHKLLTEAFFNTILLSLVTLAGALILGFVLFAMMRSKITYVKAIAEVFSEIIMGTPLLVMIFLVVYPFGQLVGSDNKLLLGVIAMILYNSPYVANAYESTAAVVTDEQYIVMDLYNFKWYDRYRYVIIPQMIRPFIPSLINNLSSVIKGSALLNIISIPEITYMTTVISSRNYAFIEGYYVMWLLYLIVTIPLSLIAKIIARKVSQ
ncbi:ABC transporter permease subunit [Candidatus Epulonipiscium viviparus]|uniref:ABC transporter permease subunit n=1 Tax=Candidatus Epulonipiscium viviparus TaxID=420336 RepID=UPI00273813B7|nr:ABC transporter permease subunit [Candidatus Epulopiscium viviparus]